MAEQGFLSRWSRLKTEAREAPPGQQAVAPAGPAHPAATPPVHERQPVAPDLVPTSAGPHDAGQALPQPTLDDAMRLGPDSDYSAFVARGVDPSVRRHALRRLFTDPHFNVIDGLDVYMGDYTKPDPMPPAMLASLQQANAWLCKQVNDNQDEVESAQPGAAAVTAQDQHEANAPQRAPAREHDEH